MRERFEAALGTLEDGMLYLVVFVVGFILGALCMNAGVFV